MPFSDSSPTNAPLEPQTILPSLDPLNLSGASTDPLQPTALTALPTISPLETTTEVLPGALPGLRSPLPTDNPSSPSTTNLVAPMFPATGDVLTGDRPSILPNKRLDELLPNPSLIPYTSGYFTTDSTGNIGIDYLFDGGGYRGQLALFSLEGMEAYIPGSPEFIKEAARRALSESELGYIVIDDPTEGARFDGKLGENSQNSGDYKGVKQFKVTPNGHYAFMLVPNGLVADVFKNPAIGGDQRPLFSLVTANPNAAFHVGQIVDVTGTGNTFVFEDLRMDTGSDRDYNDFIFQVRNAYGVTERMDDWIAPGKDWRTSNLGKALIEYTKPYITPIVDVIPIPIPSDPSILEPPAPALPDPGDSVFPPVPTPPPVDSKPVPPVDPITPAPPSQPPVSSQPVVPVLPGETIVPPIPTSGLPPAPLFDPIDVPESSHPLVPAPNDYDFPIVNQPLIGIIDTGFAANNPDINYSNITIGYDWVGNDSNSLLAPGEGNEHGTHILGIIAATRDNGIGIEGINDQAPLWVGRAIGSGQWAESLVEYVDHFRESGQPNGVVNLSLDLTQINPDGSITTRYELTPAERAAIEYARQSGVLLVVAAGNDGGVMSALGQASQEFDNILTVGAAERVNEEIALAKAMDRSDYSSYGYGLDIVAPGGTAANPELSTVGDGMGTMAGTSVATAKVTGAISQVWAANPDLSYRQVIEILKSTATDLGDTDHDQATGFGLLNLAAAVALALATTPKKDEEIPASYIPPTWSGEGVAVPKERAAGPTFTGRILRVGDTAITGYLRVRSDPGTNYSKVVRIPVGTELQFNDETQGGLVTDTTGYGSSRTWYRLADGRGWMSGLYIQKIGVTPQPPQPPQPPQQPVGYYPELGSLSNAQWNEYTKDNTRFDYGWPDYRDERHLTPESIRNIYTDLSNTIFGRRVPVTAGYLLDPGYRAGIGIWHSGLDMSAPAGTPVKVPVGGTIVRGIQETRGNYFIGVRGDDGKLWIYGHLGSVAVAGGRIEAGQTIGTIGSANHLHLELQAGPNYRRSQSNNLTTVQNATLNPIKTYWELRNRNAPPSAQPLPPTGRRLYVVKSGDSPWAIAQRELGNGNRWREITDEAGNPLTSSLIFPDQRLYLPVAQQPGTGSPVVQPPTPTPITGNITYVNFSGTVGPSVGVNLRNSPRFADRSNRNEPYGKRLEFDAWTYGETGTDMWTGKADARWFKIKGTNLWVPSAYIWGNPPTSGATPGTGNPGSGNNPSPELSPRVRAFLDTIAYAEGTTGEKGYRTIYSYQYFDSFVDHPRRVVCAGGYCSDAAGRYQFLSSTWDSVKNTIGAQDFSPVNQDRGAVELIRRRGALTDVENGNIQAAIEKCSWEWASFPPGRYGQPLKSMSRLLAIYQTYLGKYQ